MSAHPSRIQCVLQSDWRQVGVHSIYAVTNEYVDAEEGSVHLQPERPDNLLCCLQPPAAASEPAGHQLPGYLHIVAPSGYRLSSVQIACTSARLELFTGPLSEYQHVVHGENLMADCDDISGYMLHIPLTSLRVRQCSLKFFPLLGETQSTFDIYDMELHVSSAATNPSGLGLGATVDMQTVSAMLATSERPLSGPAARMLQFLTAGPGGAARAGAAENGIENSGSSKRASDFLPMPSNQGAQPQPKKPQAESAGAEKSATAAASGSSMAAVAMMQQFLAGELRAMEQRLEDRIAERLTQMEQRQDEKFALILRRLEEQRRRQKPEAEADGRLGVGEPGLD